MAANGGARTNLNTLMSCPVFLGNTIARVEETCVWARGTISKQRHFSDHGVTGYSDLGYTTQIGGQVEIAEDWFLGGFGGHSQNRLKSDDKRFSSDSDTAEAGVTLKHRVGSWLFAGAAVYTYGWHDSMRLVDMSANDMTATANQRSHTLAGRLRGAYQVNFEHWYFQPSVDLGVTYIRIPSYREAGAGAGAHNLVFDDADDVHLSATPAIEIGTRLDGGDIVARPYMIAGVTFVSEDQWSMCARFQGDTVGNGFKQSFKIPNAVGRLALRIGYRF